MNIRDASGFKKTTEIFDREARLFSNALSLQPLQVGHLKYGGMRDSIPQAQDNPRSKTMDQPKVLDMVNLPTYSEIPKSLRRISITLSLKPPSYYCSLFQTTAGQIQVWRFRSGCYAKVPYLIIVLICKINVMVIPKILLFFF